MNLIQKKVESIVQMIHSLPAQISSSQTNLISQCSSALWFRLANFTTLHFFINPSSADASLLETIQTVSKDILLIEEHVFTLVDGFNHLSTPFSDRLQSIEFSLSQLLLRSQSLSRSFEVLVGDQIESRESPRLTSRFLIAPLIYIEIRIIAQWIVVKYTRRWLKSSRCCHLPQD